MGVVEIIGWAIIVIGVAFLFLGSLGLYRMPDVYSRMQTATKSVTFGAMGTIFGVGVVHPEWFWKTLIIAIFIAISNPISSHALARGSYKVGIKPFTLRDDEGDMDALDGVEEKSEDDE
jgi:multicomponent Na+:H+ antiporter subunit G